MSEQLPESILEQIAKHLIRHGVEFLVIGGQAEYLFGGHRPTFDVDLCYRRTGDNLQKLAAALIGLQPKLRNAPPDLPFRVDARTLSMGNNFTFETSLGPLDLLGYVEPLGEYENLLQNAEKYPLLSGIEVATIGLDDLIRVKRHIGRQKDQASLYQLLAIKAAREKFHRQ
ncbi:MAG TPA: hypothetical protein VF669_21820 [Tepidisphaeraceae bacterium]|jgi:predicted nucleotidyltransferase